MIEYFISQEDKDQWQMTGKSKPKASKVYADDTDSKRKRRERNKVHARKTRERKKFQQDIYQARIQELIKEV
jgi:hypothetical protein